jgi:hypothetical protein
MSAAAAHMLSGMVAGIEAGARLAMLRIVGGVVVIPPVLLVFSGDMPHGTAHCPVVSCKIAESSR